MEASPKSAQSARTSSSVNPQNSSNPLSKTLFTYRLFNPENMLALAICITPVTTAKSSDELSLSADDRKFDMNPRIRILSSSDSASLTALSYSSMSRTTLRPCSTVSIFARLHNDDSRAASSADPIHTS